MRNDPKAKVALLLFCSGLCALIYQTVWLREFRLIFGASTAATAAVLGIFLGGLGLGSALLGRRTEASRKPLVYFGKLEILIALTAALTPLLVWLVRQAYGATGGTFVLGQGIGTCVRLLLASLVLIVPTFLMGGTLPAAARAAESDDDLGRRALALLYGCNTLGAVTGAALSTFWLIEQFGNRGTLWLACGLNLIVTIVACVIGRNLPDATNDTRSEQATSIQAASPVRFVIIAAASVGFAFMLMELVWYRMLGPILGGSTFTFGLILVVALLGVGLGGAGYSIFSANRRATVNAFALTCALEALFIAIPYALGDRLALATLLLRPLGAMGFLGQVLGWACITTVVVLPAALVAGYQFPMLIALLGQGRAEVGRHTGLAYAANTAGAIGGSLVGGFGVLPLLAAPGAWKLISALLGVLALAASLVALWRKERLSPSAILVGLAALALLGAVGPTAAWRHSGIGAGRADLGPTPSVNRLLDFRNFHRRSIGWEAEGVESSVGVSRDNGLAFVINGKTEGNSRMDAGTQVMAGLTGAILHPAPKRALVIGLGTGSSAGWLGAIPGIERVDVVELEPAIIEVARRCAPVNQHVLENPKVKIHIGDAREILITTPEKYDIIFSEPSNPYRAGIASLFTKEFYSGVTDRLAPGGIFLQWLQAYGIDGDAIRTVFATLGSVFPAVDTWRTQATDLLLVASMRPIAMDAAVLRERVAAEPYRSALRAAWRVNSLEGFFSHYVGNDAMARAVVASGEPLCTDDRNALEFGFARGVGRRKDLRVSDQVLQFALAQRMDRPTTLTGDIDWGSVSAQVPTIEAVHAASLAELPGESTARKARRRLLNFYVNRQFAAATAFLREHPIEPLNLLELEAIAASFASTGATEAGPWIERLHEERPSDAAAIRGRWHLRRKEWLEATVAFQVAFRAWRTDPWPTLALVSQSLDDALELAATSQQPEIAQALFDSLEKEFTISLARERRLAARLYLARLTDTKPVNPQVVAALGAFGANPIWRKDVLELRVRAALAQGDPNAAHAAKDLREFMRHEPVRFESGLPARAGGVEVTPNATIAKAVQLPGVR